MKDGKDILPDNPAARLLSIYKKAINIEAKPEEASGKVWARVLNVSYAPADFFPIYAQLFTLTEEAFNKVIHFYPNQASTHQRWRNHLNGVFEKCSPYHHAWKDVKAQLRSENSGEMLQIASDGLSHYVKATTVSELSLDELKNEFIELKQLIIGNVEFSQHLKNYLINELSKILYNLDHYDLYGSAQIENSIYNIYSNAELNRSADKSFVSKFGGFVFAVAAAIALINDAAELPESLRKINSKILISTIDENKKNPPVKAYDLAANKNDIEVDVVEDD